MFLASPVLVMHQPAIREKSVSPQLLYFLIRGFVSGLRVHKGRVNTGNL